VKIITTRMISPISALLYLIYPSYRNRLILCGNSHYRFRVLLHTFKFQFADQSSFET
jgi:hypothetical protein